MAAKGNFISEMARIKPKSLGPYGLSQLKKFCERYQDKLDCGPLQNVKNDSDLLAFFKSNPENGRLPGLIIHNDLYLKKQLPRDLFLFTLPTSGEWLDFFMRNVNVVYDLEEAKEEPAQTEAPLNNTASSSEDDLSPASEPVQAKHTINYALDDIAEIINSALKSGRVKQIPLKISKPAFFENESIDYNHKFRVQTDGTFQPCADCAVIISIQNGHIAALGALRPDQEKNTYRLLFNGEDINFPELAAKSRFYLALFENSLAESLKNKTPYEGNVYLADFELTYNRISTTPNVLCIDFGTSNTSAGSYGLLTPEENNVELVEFTDSADKNIQKKLYPTLVYVQDCHDPANIKFLFGYEAKKAVIDHDYVPQASAFFEIKRWIGDLDSPVELCDENGNKVVTRRHKVVLAYLLDVIAKSENYFRKHFTKIHLSAPIKHKHVFCQRMKELLKGAEDHRGYEVLTGQECIDEAIAIVYNAISKLMESKQLQENAEKRILILDCGGGTTDMASCAFKVKTTDTGKRLEIQTQFLNGNSNFGGNNITHRILQLLKIKLACKYNPGLMGTFDLKALLPLGSEILFAQLDSETHKHLREIMRRFNESYDLAEKVIPTRFDATDKFELDKKKRNYYYLWHIAENLKIRLFEDDIIVQINFSGEKSDNYLYIYDNAGNLAKQEQPFAGLSVTIWEASRTIIADIYSLLHNLFLNGKKGFFDCEQYDYYKLSGQSCKISLFRDLIKEFIPGRRLAADPLMDNRGDASSLKLNCVEGCINFVRDWMIGRITPVITMRQPEMIYDVLVDRGNNQARLMLKSDDKNYFGVEQYGYTDNFVQFIIKNANGGIASRFKNIDFKDRSNLRQKKLPEIIESVNRISNLSVPQEDILVEQIEGAKPEATVGGNEVYLVFAAPAKNDYGLNIFRIRKSSGPNGNIYEVYEPLFRNYEDETLKQFFDGAK